MNTIEVVARSQEQAIRKAASRLNVSEDELHVIEEYEPDEKDLTEYDESADEEGATEDEPVLYVVEADMGSMLELIREWTDGFLERFRPGTTCEVVTEHGGVTIIIDADDASIFIGRQGQTLQAIQHLVTRILPQMVENCPNIMVDVGEYREKRLEQLSRLASNAAEKAIRQRRNIDLKPMPAADRKFVHNFLKNFDGITTSSYGREPRRYLVIEVPGGEGRGASSGRSGKRRGGRGGAKNKRGREDDRGGSNKGPKQPLPPLEPDTPERWEGSLPRTPPKKKTIEEALEGRVGVLRDEEEKERIRKRAQAAEPQWDPDAPLADEIE